MTPSRRPFPQDAPKRISTWRRGRIRARLAASGDGFAYIVDFPPAGTELAFSHGRFSVNEIVHPRWRNEAGTWWIDSPQPRLVILATVGSDIRAYPWHFPGITIDDLAFMATGPASGASNNIFYIPNGVIVARVLQSSLTLPVVSFVAFDGVTFGAQTVGPSIFTSGSSADNLNDMSQDGAWFLGQGEFPGDIQYRALAIHWDGSVFGPIIWCPDGIYDQGIVVNGPGSMNWHPAMTYALIEWACAIEWTGAGFGAIIGRPPGLPVLGTPGSVPVSSGSWWSPQANIVIVSDASPATQPVKVARAWQWLGASWGAELPVPNRALGGPDVNVVNASIWLKNGTYVAIGGAATLARISLHPFSEITGFAAKTDEITWQPAAQGLRQMSASPDGEYLLWSWRDAATPDTTTLSVIHINDDGTFGDRWDVIISTGNEIRLAGVDWYDPNY